MGLAEPALSQEHARVGNAMPPRQDHRGLLALPILPLLLERPEQGQNLGACTIELLEADRDQRPQGMQNLQDPSKHAELWSRPHGHHREVSQRPSIRQTLKSLHPTKPIRKLSIRT